MTHVNAAIIIAAAAVLCTAAAIYFSPYHSCMRGAEYNPNSAPLCIAGAR